MGGIIFKQKDQQLVYGLHRKQNGTTEQFVRVLNLPMS